MGGDEVMVSAVVTTRNRLELLRLTLGAALAQRDVAWQLVVVDEASTDGTSVLLDALDDPRVRVVRNDRPVGPSAARNAGVAASTGRWVAFCDDDDVWAPTKLRRQLDALHEAPGARWCCAGTMSVDERLRVIGHRDLPGGDLLPRLLVANVVPATSGVIVERDLFLEVGGFDESMWSSEDWDLWIRLAEHSPVAAVHAPMVAYRAAAGGSLSGKLSAMRDSARLIGDRYADLAAAHGVHLDVVGHERYLADQALKAGDRRRAAATFWAIARRQRSMADLARAAAAAVAPRWLDERGDERGAARVPPDWRADFAAWMTTITPA